MSCVKLEIGGGHRPQPGYTNVDVRDLPTVDVVVSDYHLPMYADNSVDEILSIHTLEHFTIIDAEAALREWRRVLKNDSSLILCVPCLDRMVNNWQGREKAACEHVFGTNDWPGNEHRAFWISGVLKETLERAGFRVTEELYKFPIHQKDWTVRLRCLK